MTHDYPKCFAFYVRIERTEQSLHLSHAFIRTGFRELNSWAENRPMQRSIKQPLGIDPITNPNPSNSDSDA